MQESDSLKIFFSRAYENEMDEISKAFSEIVPVEVGYLPPTKRFGEDDEIFELWSLPPAQVVFVLGFVSGSIATGFLKAFGSDLYEKAKEKLLKALKLLDRSNLSLRFAMTYKETTIWIKSKTDNMEELNKIFATIDKARDIAISKIDKEKNDKMTGIVVSYDRKNSKWELTRIEGSYDNKTAKRETE